MKDSVSLCWEKMKQNMIPVESSECVNNFLKWYNEKIEASFAEGYAVWGHWKIYFNKAQWEKYNENFYEWQYAEKGLLAFDGEYDEHTINEEMYNLYLQDTHE